MSDYLSATDGHLSVPLDVGGTEFQLAVWQQLIQIPVGTTTSYGAVAKALGRQRQAVLSVLLSDTTPLQSILLAIAWSAKTAASLGSDETLPLKKRILARESVLLQGCNDMTDWRTTDIVGTLRFIGWNPSRERSLETASQSNILVFGGMAGETHGGPTRASCVRVKNLFDPGTEIFNSRQLSVLSTEELDQIAQDMGVPSLNPEWVGANLVIEGMDHLSLLPPSALQFDSGATIRRLRDEQTLQIPSRGHRNSALIKVSFCKGCVQPSWVHGLR